VVLESSRLSGEDDHFDYTQPFFVEEVAHSLGINDPIHLSLDLGSVTLSNFDQEGVSVPRQGFHLVLGTREREMSTMTQISHLITLIMKQGATVELVVHQFTPADFPVGWLDWIPRLTKMTLNGKFAARILQYLGQRCENVNGEAHWPCPSLLEIDLRLASGCSVTEIRHWVRDRWIKLAKNRGEGLEGLIKITGRKSTERWRPAD